MTSPIDLDVPDYESVIVVGGFPQAGRSVEVRFGLSEDIIAPYDSSRARALAGLVRAALFDGEGVFLDSLRYDPEADGLRPLYRSSVSLRPGTTLELRASAPGAASVRAVTSIPEAVPVRAEFVSIAADGTTRYALRWTDPAGPGAYHIAVLNSALNSRASFTSADPDLRASFEEIDEPVGADPTDGGIGVYIGEAVLRDGRFDGQAREVFIDVEPSFHRPTSVRASLSALSSDFVRYHQSVDLQRASIGNPFVEPTRVYSNVEGGLGAFAGYTTTAATASP